jgi:hypothetical protein
MRIFGRILSGLAVAFLAFDSVAKLAQIQPVIDGTMSLGYSRDVVFPLGVTLMACLVTYLIPRTAALGALLLTGYLGGAVASQIRVANPLFTHTLFPVYVAMLIWGGLILRDARVRALAPWRREA